MSSTATSPPVAERLPRLFGAIKFQETAFALPFAYSGMLLAAWGWPTWHQFIWITVAMVSARTLGMSVNRIIDRQIDARNPRTADRHLPQGTLRLRDMTTLAAVSAVVFFIAAAQLNTLTLALSPVAAGYLLFYPYTKRFTWTANILLGWALAIAPSAAWVGVRGSLDWEPVLLSIAVAFWAGSFDILYHTQDRDHYAANGLHSIAQRFGLRAAFWWARAMDVIALASLFALGFVMDLAMPYYMGCSIAAAFMVYKHLIVSPDDLSRMGMAFFRINAYVSTIVFLGTSVAVLNG